MEGELTWRTLSAMYSLYEGYKIPATKKSDNKFRNLMSRKLVHYQPGNHNYLIKDEKYDDYFAKRYLEDYLEYDQFLKSVQPDVNGRQTYTVNDIRSLQFIADNKIQIRNSLTTRHTFSEEFFEHGGSKHLNIYPGLNRLVLSILKVEDYPQDDPKKHQWRFVVDVGDPRCIVLCENLNFLKIPRVAREHKIELWYVGGNNTKGTPFIDEKKLDKPLFYSCDWDCSGLEIYTRLKKIFQKRGCDIKLLYPSEPIKKYPVDMKRHKSKWKLTLPFSGLEQSLFTPKEIYLINELISTDKWVEEETNNLVLMVKSYMDL